MNRNVAQALDSLYPGMPRNEGGLVLVPLLTSHDIHASYLLADESLERGRLHLQEVSGSGHRQYLEARNQGHRPVLLHEGDQLSGASQNRVMNTTVLLGSGRRIVPVSCTEQGRWSPSALGVRLEDALAHPSFRRLKESQVRNSPGRYLCPTSPDPAMFLGRAPEFQTRQGAISQHIRGYVDYTGVRGLTGALADIYHAHWHQVAGMSRCLGGFAPARGEYRLPTHHHQSPQERVAGVAAFRDGHFLCLDALWPAECFQRLAPRLLRGYGLERVAEPAAWTALGWFADTDLRQTVRRVLCALLQGRSEVRPSVDLGDDVRLTAPQLSGAGLLWGDRLLQMSVYPERAAA
jgi:hypothetical protein